VSSIKGSTKGSFEALRDVLAKNVADEKDLGASICVIHHGEVVADLWGGYVDAAQTREWQSDTLVNVWSTTKTMTFLVALMLVERGLLSFNERVATYWPEFAQNGKSDIEVRHVMGHTAGLATFDALTNVEDLADWDLCVTALARQTPMWSSRQTSGYHAVTQGYLLGELVRRITGATFGQYFKSEVADVLGADFFIGLPESEEPRVSLVQPSPRIDVSGLDVDSVGYKTLSTLDPTLPQHRWWRAAEIPAGNGHGNARSVAMIQEIIANNGHAKGHRFFSEKTGDQIFQSQANGVDLVLGHVVNFGMGYGLTSSWTPIGPRTCFWGGYGGSLIMMDQDLELTVSYMMNQMRGTLSVDDRGPGIALTATLAALG
jgi:CubicO group peptidase (beta-lactamase class C family)